MAGKHIIKLIATLVVVAISLSYLIPIKDKDFSEYLRSTTENSEFLELLERAEALEADENASISSVYMGLKTIANEERLDVSAFFPEIPLESSLTNLEKRNQLLLSELHNRSKSKLKKGLDIKGGISVTFQADPTQFSDDDDYTRTNKLSKAIEILEKRVNTYGVSEPVVRKSGEYRIEIQLADVSTKDNPDLIGDISAPAKLEFREVHRTRSPLDGGSVPFGYEVLTRIDESGQNSLSDNLYVKRIPALTGKYVKKANALPQDIGSYYYVSLDFDSEGAELFGRVTRELAGTGRLAIVLDGQLISAPNVNEAITGGSAQITGDFSRREAESLANALNNPLDIRLEIAELYEVGPTLATDSINSGVKAAIIGASLVSIFMIIYYMVGGFIALMSVVANILIVLGMLASFQATLTLPGIAGIILTVGMAVDANILIFERIREELTEGKSLKAALTGGFEKVFSTIFDANLTTFIVSLTMISFGTGPVKGFGVALAIGVVTTVFCALVVSRLLLELAIEVAGLKKFVMLSIVKSPKFDFLKPRKLAFAISWCVVLVGIVGVYVKRDSIFGIDFTGGDEVTLNFTQKIDESALRKVLDPETLGEVNPQYFQPIGGTKEILKLQTEFKRGKDVTSVLQVAFPEAEFDIAGESQVGPSVGSEIQLNALKAVGISLGLILLYIAIRFEIGYGVGAVVATVHDILLTIGIFVLFGHQFTAPMVAAILLIVGYSLNDTIVLFDRIREELDLRPTMKLYEVVNVAMNAVLSRSLLTSITTLLAAVSLMVWGTGVINDIAFTFTIGIITGTFSSIFIASPVFFFWHKGDRRSVEKSHDEAPEYDWQAASKPSN
ncbi:protein translocase subunit SecD [Puniceicoccaceae bacterium K14]|nr:protein translocase subunit SecD [Puniceicoccaceae bacterium K14]